MVDYAADEPSRVKDMITHIQFDQASVFSTSGTGNDVSVYWEPRLTCAADPFTTHSLVDNIPHDHLPSERCPISSRSRSPSPAENPYYSDTQADSDAPSQPSTAQAPHPDSDVKLAARVQFPNCQRSCSGGILENNRSTAIRTVTKIKVGCKTQASTTRQTYKRKADSPDGVDAGHDADRENIIPSRTPAIKHICRESHHDGPPSLSKITPAKIQSSPLVVPMGMPTTNKPSRLYNQKPYVRPLKTRRATGAIDKGVPWCALHQPEGCSIRSCIKQEEVMEFRVVVQCFWCAVRIGRVPQIPQIVWQAACIDFARVSAAALGPDPSPDGTGALFQRLSPQWLIIFSTETLIDSVRVN
ncbi:hypothetical protein EDD22DRAFT_852214 [Suillus occidentalis]|nr:hypothetical protein EDD22DRAFT_852214 [Suillus occidentalis]